MSEAATPHITDEELSELERLDKAATKGPWGWYSEDQSMATRTATLRGDCNSSKGGIPPAQFAELRATGTKPDAALRHWSEICQKLKTRSWNAPSIKALVRLTETEMKRPLPSDFDVEAHRLEWLRSGGHDPQTAGRRKRSTGWTAEALEYREVGHVDGLARWEKLNNLIIDRPL